MCIGNTFALTELVLVIATIARQGRIHLTSDREIAPRPLITLRPAEPITARFHRDPGGPDKTEHPAPAGLDLAACGA